MSRIRNAAVATLFVAGLLGVIGAAGHTSRPAGDPRPAYEVPTAAVATPLVDRPPLPDPSRRAPDVFAVLGAVAAALVCFHAARAGRRSGRRRPAFRFPAPRLRGPPLPVVAA